MMLRRAPEKTKDILQAETVAYWSGLNGLEIKYVDDEYMYAVSGSWNGKPKAHKVKIYFNAHGVPYVRIHGYIIKFDECIRTNI